MNIADKVAEAVISRGDLAHLALFVWASGASALLAMTLFMVGMALITYRFGFGMKQNQRSIMALGMGTRNVAAVLAAALAIPDADPRIVVMTIMWTLWSVVLAGMGAKIFAKLADKTEAQVSTGASAG